MVRKNMDQGLQNGLNNITGYVYSILKFLSLIGLGIAYYFVTHHGIGKAVLATVAAVLLWFAPWWRTSPRTWAAPLRSNRRLRPDRAADNRIPLASGVRLVLPDLLFVGP